MSGQFQFDNASFPANDWTDLFASRAARLYMKMTDSNRAFMTENEPHNALADSDALFDDYLEPSFYECFCETSGDQPTSGIASAGDSASSAGSMDANEGHDASSDFAFHVPTPNVLPSPPSLNTPVETSNRTQLGLSSPSRFSSPQGCVDSHSDLRLSAPSLPLRGDMSLAGVKISTSLPPLEDVQEVEEDEAEESASGKQAGACPLRAYSPPFTQTLLEGSCEVSGDALAVNDIRETTAEPHDSHNLEDKKTSPGCVSDELYKTRPGTPAPSGHSFDDESTEGEPLPGTPLPSAETAEVNTEEAGPTPAEEPTVLGSTPEVPSPSSSATTAIEESSAPPVSPATATSKKRKRVVEGHDESEL
ncbi:hypothetical protein ACEPAH_7784 [Sanghuangporus vaninii]